MEYKIEGKKYIYDVGFSTTDRETIKLSMKSRKFDWDKKEWSAPVNLRNTFRTEYHFGETNPFIPYDTPLPDTPVEGLWEHQSRMYWHIKNRRKCFIAGEPRTGKTRPALFVAAHEGIKTIWWIAPLSAIKGLETELREINYPYEVITYSYEKFIRVWGKKSVPPQMVVFDECHKLKGMKVTYTKALALATAQEKLYGDSAIRVVMSGTPVTKDPSDVYGP